MEGSKKGRRWAAVTADVRGHCLVGMHVAPPKSADPSRHAQAPTVAWLDLIMSAAFAPHEVRANAQIITLQRGEFLAGRTYWAKRWNWGEQAVRGFFSRLAHAGMIAISNQDSNQSITVGKISNYEAFQSIGGERQPGAQPRSNQTPTREQPHITKDTKCTKKDPLTPKGASTEVRDAFDAYNALASRLGLAKAEKLTADRARKIAARMADYGLDGWRKAIDNIEQSPFLMGRTHHAFRVGLDFVCQPARFSKLHDGGYSSSIGLPALRLLDLGDGEQHISRYGRA